MGSHAEGLGLNDAGLLRQHALIGGQWCDADAGGRCEVRNPANAALLGSALLQGRLVPRVIPLVGLVGAPLLTVSACGTLFGWFDQVSVWGAVGALPIALWELALGLWLGLQACHPALAQPLKLTLGHGAAPSNPRHEAAVKFAEAVKAKGLKGKVKIV